MISKENPDVHSVREEGSYRVEIKNSVNHFHSLKIQNLFPLFLDKYSGIATCNSMILKFSLAKMNYIFSKNVTVLITL